MAGAGSSSFTESSAAERRVNALQRRRAVEPGAVALRVSPYSLHAAMRSVAPGGLQSLSQQS
jgi:hypothetical protein